MSIAPTLQRYLDQYVTYEMISHAPTMSSARTAQVCHVSGDQLAKGVILRSRDMYILAILPASHSVRLSDLAERYGGDIAFAEEREFVALFPDCDRGAVPAVGECYSLETIVDDSLDGQLDIYMEAGDHSTLIHIPRAQFAALVSDAWHGRFSIRATH